MDGDSLFGNNKNRGTESFVQNAEDEEQLSKRNSSSSSNLFPSMKQNECKSNDFSTEKTTENELFNITSKAQTNYDASHSVDDIHSSVLHRILDSNSINDDKTNDRMYYTKLYDSHTSGNTESSSAYEIEDFAAYNRMLIREDRIKSKLLNIAKKKGKKSNTLTTLNDIELQNMFVQPQTAKEWNEMETPKTDYFNRSRVKNIFKWSMKKKREVSERPAHELVHGNASENSTVVIDDDMDSDEVSIDFQQVKRNRPFFDDIDIIVSNQEKLDYNLNNIDQYEEYDPIGGDIPHRTKSKLMKFFDTINILRLIRVQKANKYQIQRKLNVRHLNQIALGGTLGVGLLLSSGKVFSIAGPLGCLIGFIISGSLVVATMLSFCEIVTLIPLCGGVSGIASRFIDDSFGFALGVVYWVSYSIGLPSEITAATIMVTFYSDLGSPGKGTAGWITLFYLSTVIINLFDIRVYGEFEYYSTIVKVLFLLGLLIYNIILNTGHTAPLYQKIGTKFWDTSQSDLAQNITFGPFRPTFDVNDVGLGSMNGIGGNTGIFLQILAASVISAYAYVGTEIVIIAGSEARNPRRALPVATQNIYWRILVFYLTSILIIGFNVYAGDPRLLRYFNTSKDSSLDVEETQKNIIRIIGGGYCASHIYSMGGNSNGNQSPWVIAVQNASACTFASAVNAFMLYFAVTSGVSQLYASSRSLYFLALQNKAPNIFTICNKKGVPYMSVLFTAAFGSLAYLTVGNDTALVFERMVSICASTGLLVWSCMNLSFIRFYYALKLRPDIISRNEENYPYRSPFQPYLSYFGMITSFLLVMVSGFVVFLHNEWTSMVFISSYGSLFLFIACYLAFWLFRRTKIHRLDRIDLDSGRREIDRIIWEDEENYTYNFKEMVQKGFRLIF